MNELVLFSDDIEVKKAQELVQSRYKLSPLPLKLITTLIGSVQDTDEPNKKYIIRVKDYTDLQNLKGNDYYKKLKDACYEIMSRPIIIGKKGQKDFSMFNWASSCIYKSGEGLIEFKISDELLPYIKDLKNSYLKYDLINILQLRSDYSIRIYEWLKDEFNKNARYGKKAELILKIEFIREKLEIPISYRWDNIKTQILNKSKEDLEKNCDIKFEWEIASKNGRAISHIKFKIYPNKTNLERVIPSFLDTFMKYTNYLRELYKGSQKFFLLMNYELGEGKQTYYFSINHDGYMYAISSTGGESKEMTKVQSELIYNASYLCSKHSEIYREFISSKSDFWELRKDTENKDYWKIIETEIITVLKEHDCRVKPMF